MTTSNMFFLKCVQNSNTKFILVWDKSKTQGFPGGSNSKESAAMQETWLWSLGQKDPLEKGKATHCCILAWRIPWTKESGGLQSRDCKESDMTDFHFQKQNNILWNKPIIERHLLKSVLKMGVIPRDSGSTPFMP